MHCSANATLLFYRDKDDNYGPVPSSQSSSKPSNSVEDDFDDFDPRGSSNSGKFSTSMGKAVESMHYFNVYYLLVQQMDSLSSMVQLYTF